MIKTIEEIKKEIIDIVKSTDNYQLQEAIIFKILYQIDSENLYDEIMLYLRYQNLYDISYPSRIIPMIKEFEKDYYNLDEYSNILEIYYQIIKKINILSKELNLTNSLEISLLFTHLLYNGYLSYNKIHLFQSKERLQLPFMYAIDIFFGRGVCLNSSEMLTDIMISNNYQSSVISNYYGNDIDIDYHQEGIKIEVYKDSILHKILKFIDRPNSKKYGNHACTLIFEDDKPYIFDPTNLTIYEITEDNRVAINLIGSGEIYLKPYFSYTFCKSQNYKDVLERLCFLNNPKSPYTKKDFITISEKVSSLVSNNKLLDSFYEEIKPDINEIVSSFEQEKTKVRKK